MVEDARKQYTEGNNAGNGYAVGDESDNINSVAELLDEGWILVRSASSVDDIAIYEKNGKHVGVGDVNGPWAVDLFLD